jgi:hypothetical protein
LIFASRHDGYVDVLTGLLASETRAALGAYAAGDWKNDAGLHNYHSHLAIDSLAEVESAIADALKRRPHAWEKLVIALEEQRRRFEPIS